jgi:hypothetical protein
LRTGRAGGALRTSLTLDALDALDPLKALCARGAGSARLANVALRTLWTGVTLRALRASWALSTSGAGRTSWALRAGFTLDPLNALRARRSNRTGCANRARRSGRTSSACGAPSAGVALRPLRTSRALWTGGARARLVLRDSDRPRLRRDRFRVRGGLVGLRSGVVGLFGQPECFLREGREVRCARGWRRQEKSKRDQGNEHPLGTTVGEGHFPVPRPLARMPLTLDGSPGHPPKGGFRRERYSGSADARQRSKDSRICPTSCAASFAPAGTAALRL